jgi:hypothetical protein
MKKMFSLSFVLILAVSLMGCFLVPEGKSTMDTVRNLFVAQAMAADPATVEVWDGGAWQVWVNVNSEMTYTTTSPGDYLRVRIYAGEALHPAIQGALTFTGVDVSRTGNKYFLEIYSKTSMTFDISYYPLSTFIKVPIGPRTFNLP